MWQSLKRIFPLCRLDRALRAEPLLFEELSLSYCLGQGWMCSMKSASPSVWHCSDTGYVIRRCCCYLGIAEVFFNTSVLIKGVSELQLWDWWDWWHKLWLDDKLCMSVYPPSRDDPQGWPKRWNRLKTVKISSTQSLSLHEEKSRTMNTKLCHLA